MANYQSAPDTSEDLLKPKKPVAAAPSVFGALAGAPAVNLQSQAAQAPTAAVTAPPQPVDYRTSDQGLVNAVYQKYNIPVPTSPADNNLPYSTVANQFGGLDSATALALLRSYATNPQVKAYLDNPGVFSAVSSAYTTGLSSGTPAPTRASDTFENEFGLTNAQSTLQPTFDALPAAYKSSLGLKSVQDYYNYLTGTAANGPGAVAVNAQLAPYRAASSQAKQLLPYMSFDQAQSALQNPGPLAQYSGLTTQDITDAAKKIVALGPPPASDLGDPYISPILANQPPADPNAPVDPNAANPVFPAPVAGTTPPTDTTQSDLAALFSPEQLKMLQDQLTPQANDELLQQQQDQIKQSIADDTAKNVASARGEAAVRGLTGGSFEGRRVGAAQAAGTRATAEQLTNLAVENAKQQRADSLTREQTLSTQLFSQMQQEDTQAFQAQQTQLQNAFTTQSAELQRQYDSLEAYKQRAFTAGESDKGRYYQAQQDEISRQFQLQLAQYQAAVQKAQQDAADKANRKNAIIGAIGGAAGSLVQLPFLLNKINTPAATPKP